VTVLSTALTKICIAGLLETLEEVLVRMPAVAARVAAFPGAQLFSLLTLTALAVSCVAFASTPKTRRGIALPAARRIALPLLDILLGSVSAAPIPAGVEALA
jgi:hypothetical protein